MTAEQRKDRRWLCAGCGIVVPLDPADKPPWHPAPGTDLACYGHMVKVVQTLGWIVGTHDPQPHPVWIEYDPEAASATPNNETTDA